MAISASAQLVSVEQQQLRLPQQRSKQIEIIFFNGSSAVRTPCTLAESESLPHNEGTGIVCQADANMPGQPGNDLQRRISGNGRHHFQSFTESSLTGVTVGHSEAIRERSEGLLFNQGPSITPFNQGPRIKLLVTSGRLPTRYPAAPCLRASRSFPALSRLPPPSPPPPGP